MQKIDYNKNDLIRVVLVIMILVFFPLYKYLEERHFKSGFEAGRTEGRSEVTSELQQKAIDLGYGRWVIVDDFNGITEYEWIVKEDK